MFLWRSCANRCGILLSWARNNFTCNNKLTLPHVFCCSQGLGGFYRGFSANMLNTFSMQLCAFDAACTGHSLRKLIRPHLPRAVRSSSVPTSTGRLWFERPTSARSVQPCIGAPGLQRPSVQRTSCLSPRSPEFCLLKAFFGVSCTRRVADVGHHTELNFYLALLLVLSLNSLRFPSPSSRHDSSLKLGRTARPFGKPSRTFCVLTASQACGEAFSLRWS